MGLVNLVAGQEKSFGLFGTAASTPGFDAQAQSYVSVPSEMTTAGSKNKYMTISVWSNSWSVPALE